MTYPKNQSENHWVLNIGEYIDNELVVPEPEIVHLVKNYQEFTVTAKGKAIQERKLRKVGNE